MLLNIRATCHGTDAQLYGRQLLGNTNSILCGWPVLFRDPPPKWPHPGHAHDSRLKKLPSNMNTTGTNQGPSGGLRFPNFNVFSYTSVSRKKKTNASHYAQHVQKIRNSESPTYGWDPQGIGLAKCTEHRPCNMGQHACFTTTYLYLELGLR